MLLILLSLLFVYQGISQKKKQNVIFILVDDLGWKDLTCYGSDFYETPNVDALAKSGMSFSDAYSASPLCSPTRASILTGLEPGRLRFTAPLGHLEQEILDPKETSTAAPYIKASVPESRTRLPNEYLTFPEILKQNGYSTAFMGKWHLGSAPYIPENQGFDVVVGGREHPGPPGPGHFFAPWDCETLPVVPEGTHISDVITDKAVDYIKSNKDNPFLLCLWFYDVHAPFQAKETLKQKYSAKLNAEHIQRSPTMASMIETMDINVGRIMQTIKDLKLEDDTIIVFTSDNGGNMYDGPDGTNPTNNYPLRGGKGNNYEGGVRVPLIIKVPGLTKAGSKSDVITSTVDHYNSLLELLDIPMPEEVTTDGFSYVKALKGEKYKRGPIYSTFCHNVPATDNRANISMREGPWRLYKFYFDAADYGHRYELYNLEDDIGETTNLVDKMPQKVIEMTILLDEHVEEAEILLPQKNINYQGNTADAWFGSNDTKISISNKTLQIKSTGTNPEVETVYTPNVNNGIFYFSFEMKSTSKGNGTINWKVNTDEIYATGSKVPFSPIHDSKWHNYKVKIPLNGQLSSIMIKPSENHGEFEIRNMALISKDDYLIREWLLY